MTDAKPYLSLSAYLKEQYGEKLYKISLDGGFTCPNRNGTLGQRGCIFCSAGGSGEFAEALPRSAALEDPQRFTTLVHTQLEAAMQKIRDKKGDCLFIAYFQAYTNTYADPAYLDALYRAALSHPLVRGISIATRPDCLGAPVLTVLKRCREAFADKFIWVELGLQTVHEETARYIRRGYTLPCFAHALQDLHGLAIPVIVHVILGLPYETEADMLQTISYLNGCGIFGIKLQLLYILKGTDLAAEYYAGHFPALTKEQYLALLVNCIDHLDPSVVVHRVTGDAPADLLIAPDWSRNKKDVLNSLHRRMREGGHYQGRLTELKNSMITNDMKKVFYE